MLKTCLSSTSVDLRAYKKNFLFSILFIIVIKILFVFRAKQMQSKLLLISNLLLGEKSVRASAPKILNSFGKMGGNQWDALRASHLLALKKPLSSVLVGKKGGKPGGRPSRFPPSGFEKAVKFCFGVFIVPNSHLFPKQSEVMTSHAPRAWWLETAPYARSKPATPKEKTLLAFLIWRG